MSAYFAHRKPIADGRPYFFRNAAARRLAVSIGFKHYLPSLAFSCGIVAPFEFLFNTSRLNFHHSFDDFGNVRIRSFRDSKYALNLHESTAAHPRPLLLFELIATCRKAFGLNGSKASIIKPWVGILAVGNRPFSNVRDTEIASMISGFVD